VLKYTYVFGYYLPDGPEKVLFEFLQQQLEMSTEHLSELSEQPIEKLNRADVTNYTRVTARFMNNLLEGVEQGLTGDMGEDDTVFASAASSDPTPSVAPESSALSSSSIPPIVQPSPTPATTSSASAISPPTSPPASASSPLLASSSAAATAAKPSGSSAASSTSSSGRGFFKSLWR